MQFCKKDVGDVTADVPESSLTKNPVVQPIKLIRGCFQSNPNYKIYYDSISYDQNNRINYDHCIPKFTYKYYDHKIIVFYDKYNTNEDVIAYTYKLNEFGNPTEIKKEILGNDLDGSPNLVRIGYNGSLIIYKVDEFDTSRDSTTYIYTGSNITKTMYYKDKVLKETYEYTQDNKINPYRGYIINGIFFDVENFMNINNITYSEHIYINRYIFKTKYEYIYDRDNLPTKMTSTTLSEGPYINTYYYTYN
jgi:hypothetical protein